MATRTTNSDVAAILGLPVCSEFEYAILTASTLVSEELATSGLSEKRLELIEGYLAAHFASQALNEGSGIIVKEQVGESSISYATNSERFTGFMSSRFGQMALQLDTTGTLSNLMLTAKRAYFATV